MNMTPAYGRDYKSKKAVEADFNENKDFIIADMSSPWDGKPANKSDLISADVKSVSIRYNSLRSICLIDIK